MSSTKQSQLPGTLPDDDTNTTDDVSKNPRRADLPEEIYQYSEGLLTELASLGWNAEDVAEEVEDDFEHVKRRFEHVGIKPDPRKIPDDGAYAGLLWRNDPEDFPQWGDSK